ncbi:hypothetical protein GCM10009835_13930 [Planosporangium flavigriseum]|uniref:Uncharacterized protein n=2 Tax=Planosporangium flavigriseum TaxID=373681 RepID=A0A8J3LW25_9ACTN|nr:hypothetical protein Pfl04_32780 [Planosporangium flavigriseum]
MLVSISQYLESKATDRTEPAVLLSRFQQARHLMPDTLRRYADMADTAALVAVLAAGACGPRPRRPGTGTGGSALAAAPRDPSQLTVADKLLCVSRTPARPSCNRIRVHNCVDCLGPPTVPTLGPRDS